MIEFLGFLARTSRAVLLASVLAGVASGVTGVASIAAIQSELGRGAPGARWVALSFAALCLASAASRVVAQVMMVRLGQGAVAEITLRLAGELLGLPLRAFEAMDRSRLLVLLTEDIGIIANALVGVPQLCINGPIVLACLAYVGWLSPPVLLIGVLVTSVAVWAYIMASSKGMESLRKSRQHQDVLVGHLRGLVNGFRELKLHRGRREALVAEGIGPAAGEVRRRNNEGLAWFAVANGWGQLVFFGFIGLVLFVFPSFLTIDRRSLISMVLVVLYLMVPLDVILNWVPILGRGRASLHRIGVVMTALPPAATAADLPPGPPATRAEAPGEFESIELDGVTFAYGDGFLLGPVDLTIRRGELVFLVGGNGSGKTTLIKLIAGLYEPDAGAIRLDGREVDASGVEAYRALFSIVHADGHLFEDVLGLDGEDLASRASEGLGRFELDDEVTLDDRRFSTVDLSQGRRRRLALLGALLEDRPVCILDEWAANQDPRFRRAFYRELLPEWKATGKTLLVISHDEAYFDVADRVVRLGDGQVAEVSSPLVTSGKSQE